VRRCAVVLLTSVLLAAASAAAQEATEAILAVQVNLEAKGDYLVRIAPDGDILVRGDELSQLGLSALAAGVEGDAYASLRALPGLTYRLDTERLVLAIHVEPRHLERRQVLDFGQRRSRDVLRPRPAGAFFNYNLTHTSAGGFLDTRDAAAELGVRFNEYLLSSDGYSQEDPVSGERRNVRLNSSLVRDRPETLERLVFGDFLTLQPGPLGSSLRLGGVSLARRFSIDPYYVRFPGQVVTGTATLPSEVFVYANGVLVRRERVAPGGFELTNLVTGPGLQATEVVVRDVLGNEERIVDPFYYSDSLLRPGLDEYSFDAGFERRRFGLASADYGKLGVAGFYRRGVTPRLTLGGHGESLDGRRAAAATAAFGVGIAGVTSLSAGAGHGELGTGFAFSASHAFNSPRWSANAALRMEERAFARASPDFLAARRYDFAAGISHSLSPGSGISFGVTTSQAWEAPSTRSAALTYRRRATRDVYLSATARRFSSNGEHVNELSLTLSWNFEAAGKRNLASLQARRAGDSTSGLLQLTGGNTEAEGLAYRAAAQAQDDASGSRNVLDASLQWNARRAVLRADTYRESAAGSDRTQLGVQGGVAAVGGEWALARPITDSFAIVKVGAVPGVRVYANNQPVGATDASGTVFVPRLASYFENPVAIEDRDLPIDTIVPQARMIVLPALRSGVLLDFQARAVSAVAGRLVVRREAASLPFGDAQGSLAVAGGRRELATSREGDFYVEDVPPGRYEGEARRDGELCRFALEVPASGEVVTELGEVRCE
jgi:outer membrane usher protein